MKKLERIPSWILHLITDPKFNLRFVYIVLIGSSEVVHSIQSHRTQCVSFLGEGFSSSADFLKWWNYIPDFVHTTDHLMPSDYRLLRDNGITHATLYALGHRSMLVLNTLVTYP